MGGTMLQQKCVYSLRLALLCVCGRAAHGPSTVCCVMRMSINIWCLYCACSPVYACALMFSLSYSGFEIFNLYAHVLGPVRSTILLTQQIIACSETK